MQKNQPTGFTLSTLPWIVAAGTFLLYLVTLNRWVTINSLPFVGKVTGWDWGFPYHAPAFYFLTFPVRWFPEAWQPLALNVFAAVCASLTLALLVRSVALLPHDRTHEQRQRERSEHSLLSVRGNWLPPLFAALVCGLQLTFWENATAATNEALDLLLLAYVIRCLLEHRVDGSDSWLYKFAFVYGLGVTNNFAMIGLAPFALAALVWIKGLSLFQFRLLSRMLLFGLAGLMFYLLLPAISAMAGDEPLSFWQALKSNWVYQKRYLLDVPVLRNRALILSLTALLPLLIIGVRWPSSFGDTSVAGNILTTVMFRVVHVVFLAACAWVAFDQQFSPRKLGFILPFLSFYYLGALAIGYFAGYVLLVFGTPASKSKSWRRRSPIAAVVDRVVFAAMWIAVVAVPVGLAYKNWAPVMANNGQVLREFADALVAPLPEEGAIILSEDPYALVLVRARLGGKGDGRYVLAHTGSLPYSEYHERLEKRYPAIWPDMPELPAGHMFDDRTLLGLMEGLATQRTVFYLQPSFGYYFESFYPNRKGLIWELARIGNGELFPPVQTGVEFDSNQGFWRNRESTFERIKTLMAADTADGRFLSRYYSRALNDWGVRMQRNRKLDEAAQSFQIASSVNPQNLPARINREFNHTLRTGEPRTNEITRTIEEQFGGSSGFRNWQEVMRENGPFDHPDFSLRLAQLFAQQDLLRQAAVEFRRVIELVPTNATARLGLAKVYLEKNHPGETLKMVEELRAPSSSIPLSAESELELVRLEAAAYFAQTNYAMAEQVLVEAQRRNPKDPGLLDSVAQLYTHTGQWTNAIEALDQLLKLTAGNLNAQLNRAALLINVGRNDEALASVDQILRNAPDNTRARLYRVFLLMQQKDLSGALSEVGQVLSKEPESIEALVYQGVIHLDRKENSEAIAAFDKVLELQPGHWNALRNRAIARLQSDDLAGAQADYERLLALVPDYHVAYYGLGEIAFRKSDREAAIRHYENYLKNLPENTSGELEAEKKLVRERLDQLRSGTP